jgi:hypothetical protein
MSKTFKIDKTNSDEKYLYVDVADKGTVVIKKTDEGIVVDIYPSHMVDEPVASTYAFNTELNNE